MGDLADADAVAEVLTHLKGDTTLLASFGGSPANVSGLPEAPFPHIVVSPGAGGDLRELLASHEPEVLLEWYAPGDGSIGSADLWRVAMRTLTSLKQMPERVQPAGRPVVCDVRVTGGLTRTPLESGQLRWQATVNVTIAPPN